MFIDLKNVTGMQAIEYILLQEQLCYDEAGPRTILIGTHVRCTSIPQIGVRVLRMSDELAKHFGVGSGILVQSVYPDTLASKAGIKAGDVIAEVGGAPVHSALAVVRAINEGTDRDLILTVVTDRKRRSVILAPEKGAGVGSILRMP